jgi:hypothetical protein
MKVAVEEGAMLYCPPCNIAKPFALAKQMFI